MAVIFSAAIRRRFYCNKRKPKATKSKRCAHILVSIFISLAHLHPCSFFALQCPLRYLDIFPMHSFHNLWQLNFLAYVT